MISWGKLAGWSLHWDALRCTKIDVGIHWKPTYCWVELYIPGFGSSGDVDW